MNIYEKISNFREDSQINFAIDVGLQAAMWSGNPHFGSNGMGAGPCVALFHGFELSDSDAWQKRKEWMGWMCWWAGGTVGTSMNQRFQEISW